MRLRETRSSFTSQAGFLIKKPRPFGATEAEAGKIRMPASEASPIRLLRVGPRHCGTAGRRAEADASVIVSYSDQRPHPMKLRHPKPQPFPLKPLFACSGTVLTKV